MAGIVLGALLAAPAGPESVKKQVDRIRREEYERSRA